MLITAMYFKDRNRIFKTVNCISCSLVCKIVFCSKFLDIPDNAGKVTRRRRSRRRRTQAIAKRYAFHTNAISQIPGRSSVMYYIYIFIFFEFSKTNIKLKITQANFKKLKSQIFNNHKYNASAYVSPFHQQAHRNEKILMVLVVFQINVGHHCCPTEEMFQLK